jgi:hypothetical protein
MFSQPTILSLAVFRLLRNCSRAPATSVVGVHKEILKEAAMFMCAEHQDIKKLFDSGEMVDTMAHFFVEDDFRRF